MTDSHIDKLTEMLGHFDTAMLVTRRGDALRSRPMAIADYTDDGRVRFIVRDDSAKLDELEEHAEVNVALQGDGRFLSISGRARLSKDDDLVDAAFSNARGMWFTSGRDDPHAIVLEVVPTYAEYWEEGDASAARYVLDRLRGAVTDDASLDEADRDRSHGEVDFRGRPL